MKKSIKILLNYSLIVALVIGCFSNYNLANASEFSDEDNGIIMDEATLIEAANAEHNEVISYYVHQQCYGDTMPVKAGEVAGNCGTNKRLEAFYITRTSANVSEYEGNIRYQAHCQSVGWTDWVTDGKLAGTSGKSKRMEAVKIELTGELAEKFDIYYKTYMSNCGWLDWTKNGEISGTVGFGATIEGIQILLVLKGSEYAPSEGRYPNITMDNMNDISYMGHVQSYGDMSMVSNGKRLGTTGKGKRLEAIKIKLSHGSNQMYGTVKYSVHCQTYGWMDEVSENIVAGTNGQAKRLEAISISLSGDIANYCDIYYRVHCQTYGWLDWAKNGGNAGTAGYSKRIEAIEIKILPKGSKAPGNTSKCYYDINKNVVTNGYLKLEPHLDDIISKCTNSSMTKEEKLRACYDYVGKNITYRTLSNDCPSNFKYHEYYAYQTVISGSGNCYGMNFLFGHLAKKLGYDVKFYKGYVGTRRDPHGWVEIEGLIYDPELEYANNVNLYGISNFDVYIYRYD